MILTSWYIQVVCTHRDFISHSWFFHQIDTAAFQEFIENRDLVGKLHKAFRWLKMAMGNPPSKYVLFCFVSFRCVLFRCVVFLLGQWLNFKLLGITYLVGKIKFKLFFSGSIGWVSVLLWKKEIYRASCCFIKSFQLEWLLFPLMQELPRKMKNLD